jgi:predicted enzyme related to lactoylglutathione lyase
MTSAGPPRGLRINDVVMDCTSHEPALAFWEQALGYARGWSSGQFAQLKDPAGVGMPLLFQLVPEAKIVKNRAHLDLAAEDMVAEVLRLAGLGARTLRELSEFGAHWTVMIDPEGNEFCVVQAG